MHQCHIHVKNQSDISTHTIFSLLPSICWRSLISHIYSVLPFFEGVTRMLIRVKCCMCRKKITYEKKQQERIIIISHRVSSHFSSGLCSLPHNNDDDDKNVKNSSWKFLWIFLSDDFFLLLPQTPTVTAWSHMRLKMMEKLLRHFARMTKVNWRTRTRSHHIIWRILIESE